VDESPNLVRRGGDSLSPLDRGDKLSPPLFPNLHAPHARRAVALAQRVGGYFVNCPIHVINILLSSA